MHHYQIEDSPLTIIYLDKTYTSVTTSNGQKHVCTIMLLEDVCAQSNANLASEEPKSVVQGKCKIQLPIWLANNDVVNAVLISDYAEFFLTHASFDILNMDITNTFSIKPYADKIAKIKKDLLPNEHTKDRQLIAQVGDNFDQKPETV